MLGDFPGVVGDSDRSNVSCGEHRNHHVFSFRVVSSVWQRFAPHIAENTSSAGPVDVKHKKWSRRNALQVRHCTLCNR